MSPTILYLRERAGFALYTIGLCFIIAGVMLANGVGGAKAMADNLTELMNKTFKHSDN